MRKLIIHAMGALALVVVTTAVLVLFGVTAAWAGIDPATRTVGTITVTFSLTDPDEIESITWNGSLNLTSTWPHPFCPAGGDLEFWGNAWANPDSFQFVSLVGWGSTGTWATNGVNRVSIHSQSEGCFGSAALNVATQYNFFSGGPAANRFRVNRTFNFGATPFAEDFRAYIPRLFPRTAFNQVLHPDAAGASLLTQNALLCEFGCLVTDWDGSWFAIHDPAAGMGLIVRHQPSPVDVALWVDVDGGSFSNASSVLLLSPPGGFTGKVTEKETLCFYDAATWPATMRVALMLPPTC